jgi:hypothetical protein
MKKAKLPLPLVILIAATLFMLSSALGEWIGRPAGASRTQPNGTVEQQQAAIVYVRVMSWLSRVITHPPAHAQDNGESMRSAEPFRAAVHPVAAHSLQLCALDRPSHPSATLRFSCRILSRPQQSQSSRAVHSAAGVLRVSSTMANGS